MGLAWQYSTYIAGDGRTGTGAKKGEGKGRSVQGTTVNMFMCVRDMADSNDSMFILLAYYLVSKSTLPYFQGMVLNDAPARIIVNSL